MVLQKITLSTVPIRYYRRVKRVTAYLRYHRRVTRFIGKIWWCKIAYTLNINAISVDTPTLTYCALYSAYKSHIWQLQQTCSSAYNSHTSIGGASPWWMYPDSKQGRAKSPPPLLLLRAIRPGASHPGDCFGATGNQAIYCP